MFRFLTQMFPINFENRASHTEDLLYPSASDMPTLDLNTIHTSVTPVIQSSILPSA